MDYYIDSGIELSLAAGIIGIVTAGYLMLYLNCSNNNNEPDRIIDTVCSVVKGEVQSLQMVKDENPYDLFTRIYPTLKTMDNDRLEEFVELVEKYNKSWISEDQ